MSRYSVYNKSSLRHPSHLFITIIIIIVIIVIIIINYYYSNNQPTATHRNPFHSFFRLYLSYYLCIAIPAHNTLSP